MPKTGRKIGKILGWFALTAIALVIIALAVAWFATPAIIKNNLSKYIYEKSDGLYQLTYNDADVKWAPFSIQINEINLVPDKQVAHTMLTKSKDKIFYSFQASQAQINGINAIKFFRSKILDIENVRIIDPEIELIGEEILQTDSSQTVDNAIKTLRPFFQHQIKKLNINKIEFINARYGISQSLGKSTQFSKAEKISVEIINFRTDSTLIHNETRFFQTDDVLIRMNNFQNKLSDSLHVVNIDTLQYSLKSSDITASGFHITAEERTAGKAIYDVHVPQLLLKSKNIVNLNISDSLDIRLLKFEQPQIKFYQKANRQKLSVEDINDFDLYTLVQSDFSKIEIDTFLLSNANLQIFRQPDLVNYQHSFERLNIKLNGFLLDSASAKNKQKLFHANDLEMSVSGYHLRLEDNQHDFRADSLFVSTFSSKMGAKQITVSPADSLHFKSRTEINITSEALEIEDVDLKRLYHTRILPTSKIEVLSPEVNMTYHQEIQKPQKQQDEGLLFEIVSAYLKGVYSNLVFIGKGVLNIKNFRHSKLQGYFETRFGFSLTDFSLDSSSVQRTDKFFYATGFDLRFADYEMRLVDDLHKINVDSITISSINQNVQINRLHLQPAIQNVTEDVMKRYNRSELYNVFVPNINLHQIDLRNAFFHNKLRIASFSISNPEIYFENFGTLRAGKNKKELAEFYQLVFNYISDFDIDIINVPNGEITWVNHTRKGKTTSFDNEFSATLENFKLNEKEIGKKRLLFSDNFDVSIKDQIFQLSDSVHILRAGEINLSTAKSSIGIKNALLYPVISSNNYHDLQTTFQVIIPELNLRDIDFIDAYFSGNFRLTKLDINNPKIQIYNQPNAFKSLELKKYNLPLPAFINSLVLDEFQINNGEVMTYETRGINHRPLSNFKVNLVIPGMELQNTEKASEELKTSNLKLSVSDFYSPLGKKHQLNIGEINFNRQQETIYIRDLQLKPFASASKNNKFTIDAPAINFTGFDFNEALEKNNFSFEKILIQTPKVKVEINDSVKSDKIDFLQTLDLYPYTEPFVDRIQINNLNLTDADINFNWFNKQLINRKIDLKFQNILVAENQPPSNLLNSSKFEISTANLRSTDKNNFYEFTADTFVYNSSEHSIRFENINVTPLVAKDEFPKLKGFQTDVVNATIDYIKLYEIDEKRWISDNVLHADLVTLGPAKVDIFRNKRYPFNHNQRPPWPQDLIRNIKQPFVFDSVTLAPSYLKYSELNALTDTPGFVDFNDLQFNAGKISNIESSINKFKHFKIDASANLYNQAILSAAFNFDLTSENYYHTVTGSLGEMPMAPLNRIVENSAPLTIESGFINRFDFNIALNKNEAIGELYIGYEDFRISMLDYSKEETTRLKLASFWANKMILNSKTEKGKDLLPVKLYYKRDEKRSIINFWWKSIYSGAQKSLGIEPKK